MWIEGRRIFRDGTYIPLVISLSIPVAPLRPSYTPYGQSEVTFNQVKAIFSTHSRFRDGLSDSPSSSAPPLPLPLSPQARSASRSSWPTSSTTSRRSAPSSSGSWSPSDGCETPFFKSQIAKFYILRRCIIDNTI